MMHELGLMLRAVPNIENAPCNSVQDQEVTEGVAESICKQLMKRFK